MNADSDVILICIFRIACSLADAIRVLHIHKILHGCISAHAVRIDPFGIAELADYGTAPLLLEAKVVLVLYEH